MESTSKLTKKILRSNEAIDLVLSVLGLTRETVSTYKDYSFPNGNYVRLRISDHGIFLQNWFDASKAKRIGNQTVPKLNIGLNLAITFAPNEEECKEKGVAFPSKIKNVTTAKTEKGNNVKPQFAVRHICYYTWKLSAEDINQIATALSQCVTEGVPFEEPLKDADRSIEWEDMSNLPPNRMTKTHRQNNKKD